MSLSHPRAATIAFALGALTIVSQASAADVVLTEFSGRKASVLRGKVENALYRSGHDVTLSDVSGRDLSRAQVVSVSREPRADAVIVGKISRPSIRKWRAVLQVRSSATGKQIGKDLVFRSTWLAGLSKELIDKAAKRLEPLLRQAEREPDAASVAASAASVEVEPEPMALSESESTDAEPTDAEDEQDETWADEPDSAADEGATDVSSVPEDGALFRLAVRGGAVRRSLRFEDDIYERLRTYDVNMGVYQVEGIVYPFTRPVGERLGIIASFESGVSGAVTDVDQNLEFDADFYEFFVGLRARYPVDEHEVGFDLTYGQMHAGLIDPEGRSKVPSTDYSVVRTSLHGALDLGAVRGTLSAGFRLPLAYGQLKEDRWFPRVSGYGVEASAGVHYALTSSIVLELTGTLRRFVLEMNSEPEDAEVGCDAREGFSTCSEVAGGAVDRYIAGYMGISYRL